MGNFYYGQDYSKVDAKFRIAIPSKQRALLGEEFKITRNVDPRRKTLCLFDESGYGVAIRSIQKLPVSLSQDMNMVFTASTFDVKPDKQGRIVIPPALREILGVAPGDTVSVAGMANYIEIDVQKVWGDKLKDIENKDTLDAALEQISFSDDQ